MNIPLISAHLTMSLGNVKAQGRSLRALPVLWTKAYGDPPSSTCNRQAYAQTHTRQSPGIRTRLLKEFADIESLSLAFIISFASPEKRLRIGGKKGTSPVNSR